MGQGNKTESWQTGLQACDWQIQNKVTKGKDQPFQSQLLN